MSKLSFDIKGDYFHVPSFRSDVKTQNDLAEEVARVIGYDNIKPSEICIPKNSELSNKNIEVIDENDTDKKSSRHIINVIA